MTADANMSRLNERAISQRLIADMKQSCRSRTVSIQPVYAQIQAYLEATISSRTRGGGTVAISELKLDSLNDLLNRTISISNNTSTTNTGDEECVRALLDSLYFMFMQQYSSLFANDRKSLDLLEHNRDLVLNETFFNITKLHPNSTVMLAPALRNMHGFLDKYKKSVGRVFDSHKLQLQYCDPQPPILCNLKTYEIYIRSTKTFTFSLPNIY